MSIKALEIHEQAGDDGVVRLAIPTGQANRSYHMIVIFDPDKTDSARQVGRRPTLPR